MVRIFSIWEDIAASWIHAEVIKQLAMKVANTRFMKNWHLGKQKNEQVAFEQRGRACQEITRAQQQKYRKIQTLHTKLLADTRRKKLCSSGEAAPITKFRALFKEKRRCTRTRVLSAFQEKRRQFCRCHGSTSFLLFGPAILHAYCGYSEDFFEGCHLTWLMKVLVSFRCESGLFRALSKLSVGKLDKNANVHLRKLRLGLVSHSCRRCACVGGCVLNRAVRVWHWSKLHWKSLKISVTP